MRIHRLATVTAAVFVVVLVFSFVSMDTDIFAMPSPVAAPEVSRSMYKLGEGRQVNPWTTAVPITGVPVTVPLEERSPWILLLQQELNGHKATSTEQRSSTNSLTSAPIEQRQDSPAPARGLPIDLELPATGE